MKPNHIAVCCPARDMVHTSFAFDLAIACSMHVAQTEDIVAPFTSAGTLICSQRTALAQEALQMGATHILWLDSDMRFPQDVIARMLAHDEPIVSCNYSQRRFPPGPVAMAHRGENEIRRIYTTDESHGLQEVDYVGMGAMMVQRRVFEAMEMPWFAIPWATNGIGYIGEDVFFCRKAREHGFPTLIDHDLSKEVAHIGAFEYRLEHTIAVRDAKDQNDSTEFVSAAA